MSSEGKSMAAGRTNWRNVIMVVSLAILIAVEIFGVALASGWALAGLFELGHVVAYALMALFSVFAAYGLLSFMRRVVKIERLSARG
ncbi:hypothetical protein [Bosea sp. CS1GBMeth4]|uniref:hypothetical protein n=1 Tax=Bosea sp. CS1GBMeth4 TaxID=1892849 RepID=UPI001FCF0566|nr:hypothetical protein [Bosea sp. CS1GBMeth4]